MIEAIREMFHDLAGRGDVPAHIGGMDITPSMRLWELALDSLARLNLAMEIEYRFGCSVLNTISDMTSLQELSSLLVAHRQSKASEAP
ncbi:putative Nodulation protein F [Azospirillaceae bacterium]